MITNDELVKMRENYAHPDNADVDRLISAYVAERKAKPTRWQRMDTAPKDGTRIIGWTDSGHFMPGLFWSDDAWISGDGRMRLGFDFIAWMPMPEAPEW